MSKKPISSDQFRQFLEPISHDLKNYLTTISLYTQTLGKSELGEKEKKYIAKITQNISACNTHLTIIGEIIKAYYSNTEIILEAISVKDCLILINQHITVENITFDDQGIEEKYININQHLLKRLLFMITESRCLTAVDNRIELHADRLTIIVNGEKNETNSLLPLTLLVEYCKKIASDLGIELETRTENELEIIKLDMMTV